MSFVNGLSFIGTKPGSKTVQLREALEHFTPAGYYLSFNIIYEIADEQFLNSFFHPMLQNEKYYFALLLRN